MSDSVLRSFTERLSHVHGARTGDDNDEPRDLGSFGWLRGANERSYMLEIRRKDGSIVAMGYFWLERVEFDPSEGITLRFTHQTVRLVGRNLNREVLPHLKLYEGLVRHRIPWVQETDEPTAMSAPQSATVIERVDFL